jgi:hypothetical protein
VGKDQKDQQRVMRVKTMKRAKRVIRVCIFKICESPTMIGISDCVVSA